MASQKQTVKFGFLAKVEAAYGVAETLAAATDGVQLSERPEPDPDQYLHDGSRGRAPGSGGELPRVPPSGLGFAMSGQMEPVGAGAAYSASVVPPGLHQMLRACGLEAAGSFTGGAEKWTYSPESGPTGYDSLTAEAYVNGQKYPGRGIYGTFGISVEGPAVPSWGFDLSGIGTAVPTDAAVPAITYPPATRQPPKAINIGFAVGTGTPFAQAKVRGFSFAMNRDLSPRADDNSAGHAGFTPGRRAPTLEVTFEGVALHTSDPWYTASTINPYKLKEEMDLIAVTLSVGSVQYNRYQLNLPQAQLGLIEEAEDGATHLWTVTFEPKLSTASADDDFNIVWN